MHSDNSHSICIRVRIPPPNSRSNSVNRAGKAPECLVFQKRLSESKTWMQGPNVGRLIQLFDARISIVLRRLKHRREVVSLELLKPTRLCYHHYHCAGLIPSLPHLPSNSSFGNRQTLYDRPLLFGLLPTIGFNRMRRTPSLKLKPALSVRTPSSVAMSK